MSTALTQCVWYPVTEKNNDKPNSITDAMKTVKGVVLRTTIYENRMGVAVAAAVSMILIPDVGLRRSEKHPHLVEICIGMNNEANFQ